MTVMPGIELERNSQGEATHIAIDLQKHPEAIPILKDAGLMPKTKAELEEEFDNGLTVDEVFDGVRQIIKDHYAKRNNHTAGKG